MRRAAAAAVALLFVGMACGDGRDGAARATTTTAVRATVAAGGGRTPVPGFGQIAYRVSTMPSTPRCALLAETDAQHQQGLMNRTDLAGHDGMLFVFASPVTVGFWMKDTPLPLSIAYFDATGRFVSSADMAPCLNRGSNCPSYDATGPYKFALEVAQDGLGGLGIGAGSVLTGGGACT